MLLRKFLNKNPTVDGVRFYEILPRVCMYSKESLSFRLYETINFFKQLEKSMVQLKENGCIENNTITSLVCSVLNSYAILIEYYHSFIITNCIGHVEPNIKISYSTLKNDDDITKIFKKYNIGQLTDLYPEEDRNEFKRQSNAIYKKYFSNYFIANFNLNELRVLNNYFKHNSIARYFSQDVTLNHNDKKYDFNYTFLLLDNIFLKTLNDSILKEIGLLEHDIHNIDDFLDKNMKIMDVKTNRGTFGKGFNISIKDIDFIKLPSFTGINVTSILFTVYSLIKYIDESIKDYKVNSGCDISTEYFPDFNLIEIEQPLTLNAIICEDQYKP